MIIIINFYALWPQTCVLWPRKQTSVLFYNAQSFLIQMFILTYVSYTRYIMVLNIILLLFYSTNYWLAITLNITQTCRIIESLLYLGFWWLLGNKEYKSCCLTWELPCAVLSDLLSGIAASSDSVSSVSVEYLSNEIVSICTFCSLNIGKYTHMKFTGQFALVLNICVFY